MRWTGHVARMGERILVGRPYERNHLEDPSVDGRRILKRIFRKWGVGYGLDRAG